MSYNEIFRERTKQLAIEIIQVISTIPYSDVVGVIRKQAVRSSTSLAANYRSMTRARSEKERYAKLSIAIEEADETLFWLEMIQELDLVHHQTLMILLKETEEIVKALSAYRKTLSK